MSPVYLLLGACLFLCNAQVAFENAATRSDHRSDHRRSMVAAEKKQSSQRSQWSQGRTEAATVAGEKASATYQSEIDAAIAADAKRWQATGECDPLKITAGPSREFCASISNLKARKAAADRRDELDAKIADLDAKAAGTEIVTSVDPFADNVAAFLSMFGVTISDATKAAISAQRNVTRSLTLELLATFGPTAWLLVVNAWLAHRPTPAPVRVPAPTQTAKREEPKPKADDEPEPVVALDDPFHRFVAECIEEVPGLRMPAGEPWQEWLAWCARNNAPTGSQKSFGGKMKTRFAREPNNNRPRYLNIRVRTAKPALRVVT